MALNEIAYKMAYMRLLAIPLCFSFILPIAGSAQETSEEFKIKEEYYEQMVEDFYTRLVMKEREESARAEASKEMKALREEKAKSREEARQEYVRDRRQKPPLDPSLWEKEVREREIAQERARKEYVIEQERYRRFRERLPKIPPEEEYEIYLETEPDEGN